jgi:hypothetical protein
MLMAWKARFAHESVVAVETLSRVRARVRA